VNIPEGTQSGQQFRLRGKGMSVLQSKLHGDMYIDAQVETPIKLTKKQKDLLREFDNSGGSEVHSPRSEGFFSKVKEFWEDLTE
jgi:molecular chaperone DnaJ